MVHRNASISNETISREQTIAKLRKLARICKWATICITTALALGLLAVIAIDLLLVLPSLSQGSCLQSVELQGGEGPCLAIVRTDAQTPLMLVAHDGHTAIGSLLMTLQGGEGPCLAIVGTDAQTPLMLVAHDGHTAIGSLLMTCLALTIAISVRRFFFNIEKEGRPFDLECNQTLRRVGNLFLIGGVAVRLLGAAITGMILSGFGGSFTDAFVGQLFEPSMLFAGLIFSLIASIFRYGYILQKQDDELL